MMKPMNEKVEMKKDVYRKKLYTLKHTCRICDPNKLFLGNTKKQLLPQ
jgi:hypothetical protein